MDLFIYFLLFFVFFMSLAAIIAYAGFSIENGIKRIKEWIKDEQSN